MGITVVVEEREPCCAATEDETDRRMDEGCGYLDLVADARLAGVETLTRVANHEDGNVDRMKAAVVSFLARPSAARRRGCVHRCSVSFSISKRPRHG